MRCPLTWKQERNIRSKVSKGDIAIEALGSIHRLAQKSDIHLAEEVLKRDAELDQREMAIRRGVKPHSHPQPAAATSPGTLAFKDKHRPRTHREPLHEHRARNHPPTASPRSSPSWTCPHGEECIEMIRNLSGDIREKRGAAKLVIGRDRDIDTSTPRSTRAQSLVHAREPAYHPQSLGLDNGFKALGRIATMRPHSEKAVYYIEGEDIRHQ